MTGVAGLSDLPLSDPRDPMKPKGVARPPLLPALTSLRFFVALHVALYHFVRPFARWGHLAGFFSSGYTGVSFFFLLSGFILTYTHAHEYESGKGDRARFWMARFARIYPVYFLSMLLAGVVQKHLLHNTQHNMLHLVVYLLDFFMVQSWSVRLVGFFNVPSWSLSCEAFFYLVFPYIFLKLRPSGRMRSLWAIAGWTAVAMIVPLLGLALYPGAGMHEFTANNWGAVQILRIRRLPILMLPEFLAGIALGWYYLRYGVSRRATGLLTAAGIGLLVIVLGFSQHLPYVMLHNGLLIPLQCALILGLTGRHWLARVLSRPWLMLLGEASYSFYLIHMQILEGMSQHFNLAMSIWNAVWRLALIAAFCVLLYLSVERPSRKLILEWYKNRTQAVQALG